MTRHVKTNEEAIELSEQVRRSLEWMIPETDKEIAFTRGLMDNPKMSAVEKAFYQSKIDSFEKNKPLIMADLELAESVRQKLTNPFRTWFSEDESKIEKLCKEQRLVIARLADRSYSSYTSRFLNGWFAAIQGGF